MSVCWEELLRDGGTVINCFPIRLYGTMCKCLETSFAVGTARLGTTLTLESIFTRLVSWVVQPLVLRDAASCKIYQLISIYCCGNVTGRGKLNLSVSSVRMSRPLRQNVHLRMMEIGLR